MPSQAYNSPGVTVTEVTSPSLTPQVSTPPLVAIVGTAVGTQTASQKFILAGTTAQPLSHTGYLSGVVKSGSTGEVLNAGTYTITNDGNTDPTLSVTSIARKAMPTVAPTQVAGTGALTGTYSYAYSFVNAGGETGIGPAGTPIAITAQGVSLSAVSVGPAGTTARNIYRKKTVGSNADSLFHLVATIADNTTTVLANEATADLTANGLAQPKTGIADPDTIVVTYTYTDNFYYAPTELADFDDVTDKYGQPWDANGLISSNLSYAARLAFLNGASDLLLVAANTSSSSDITAALAKLENQPNVTVVVIADGATTSVTALAAHVTKTYGLGQFRIGVAGEDGSTSTILATTLRTAAQAVNQEGVRLVSPANFKVPNPVTGATINIGGQFAAAAIAGMYAARDVQIPLTRKTIAGFIDLNDARTTTEQILDSAAGLLVIENKGGIIRVRHDLTTAVGSVNTRESSVVRAKYEMAHRIQSTLDSSIITVVTPSSTAPALVSSVVQGVLISLVNENVISSYDNLKARVLNDPTTIEVKFGYTPAYPINNIQVVFMIDTASGNISIG